VLWILDEGALLDGEEEAGKPERCRVTEAGAMNIFFVLSRADPSDPDLDVVTPRLDGTILPGVTRASVLSLTAAHPERTSLQGIPNHVRLHPVEQRVSMADVYAWAAEGRLKEVFCAGTAVIVAPVGALGFHGREDLIIPAAKKSNGHANGHANGYGFAEQSSDGLGLVGSAMKKRILDIQEGKIAWEGWSVACE
jgi:branched-chain amino acid aminotransferase